MSQKTDADKSGAGGVKVELFKIANRLKQKLGIREETDQPGHIDPDAIAEADKLIETLCEECPQAIAGYLEQLTEAWRKMRDMPQSPERNDVSQEILTLAHEIKDIGAMCGFVLAAHFAESLRDYIAQTELNLEAQRVIIQAHVDAMNVVNKQEIKEDAGPAAEELKAMVKVAIDKYS